MSILTSLTIIICILIIGIFNIISGYFKPEVILNRRNNKTKRALNAYKIKLDSLIKNIENAIIDENGVILDDILEDLQTMKKVIDKL
jgi:hypothetical protein